MRHNFSHLFTGLPDVFRELWQLMTDIQNITYAGVPCRKTIESDGDDLRGRVVRISDNDFTVTSSLPKNWKL